MRKLLRWMCFFALCFTLSNCVAAAFVVGGDFNNMAKCPMATRGGAIKTCKVTSLPTAGHIMILDGIIFHDGYAYMSGQYQTSSNVLAGYVQCQTNASGIEKSTCITNALDDSKGNTFPGASGGMSIANGNAYFLNPANSGTSNSYVQCPINSSGIENNNCKSVALSDGIPAQQFVNEISIHDGYAYITPCTFTSTIANSFIQCKMGSSSIKPNTCVNEAPSGNGALSDPGKILFHDGYVYFPDSNSSEIPGYTQCAADAQGIKLKTCTTAYFNTLFPTGKIGLVYSAAIHNSYIYFFAEALGFNAQHTKYVYCELGSSGILRKTCKLRILLNANKSMLHFPTASGFF